MPAGVKVTVTASEAALRRSPADARRYRAVELANGVRIVLVHDAEADKAAAAAAVCIGQTQRRYQRSCVG